MEIDRQHIQHIDEKIELHTKKLIELNKEMFVLKKKFNTASANLLTDVLKLLKIDLSENKNMYLYLTGFLYSVKEGMLSDEQLDFFKTVAQKYFKKAGE